MAQENRELLINDLCARLPFGIKVLYDTQVFEVQYIEPMYEEIKLLDNERYTLSIDEVKPYLFPLSSMTEEQAIELFNIFGISLVDSIGANYIKVNEITGITFFFQNGFDVETHLDKLIDWLHKNHFDYRGLIPKGLAEDATDKNIY